MAAGLEHAPLALFTTLAPMAAASFIVLAYVFIAVRPDAEAARRLDRWTALPAVVMALGMGAAFLHLADPSHALYVFTGVGTSPLSNELAVTVAFAVVALAYWALALAGKLPSSGGARTVLLVVLAVGSVAQAASCGLAYAIATIPTWDGPGTVLQQLGCAWLGGAALGAAQCALAKVALPRPAVLATAGLAALGVLTALAGAALQGASLGTLANIWGPASALAPGLWQGAGLFAACGVAACVLVAVAGRRGGSADASPARVGVLSGVPALAALAVAAVGVLAIRFAFYGLYMGVAL
ncbi:MAG: dimethyl sulfoxide reductase anchor subunit [Eggerthellaceae bacterium]|nr:dimethyl sulfoxide reductase anchor subunit [Eggerthellaceae bacterium]